MANWIRCKECGNKERLHAKGLCINCYSKLRARGKAVGKKFAATEVIAGERIVEEAAEKVENDVIGCYCGGGVRC